MQRRLSVVILGLSALGATSGCQPFGVPDPGRPFTEATDDRLSITDFHQQQLVEARAAVNAGQYGRALGMFRDILAENPTVTTAYLGIGDIYMLQEDFAHAEPAFRQAVRLEPRNFTAQYSLGLALQMLKKFAEAAQVYIIALDIDPNSPEANLNIATVYLQTAQAKRALPYARKAVELQPDSGAARVNLGAVYEDLGMNVQAIDEYIKALELLDETTPVMMNLINVLAREKRYQEAVNTALQLIRIEPTANAYERLGWAYFRLNRYPESLQAYRDGVELDPSHWPSLNGVGVNALNTWLLSNRTDEAARKEAGDAFRRSLRINSDQPRVIQLMLNYQLQ